MSTMTTNRFSLVAEASLDRHLFLARTLAHGEGLGDISPEKADTLYQSIAAIAHKLITMKTADFSDEAAIRAQIQTAFTLTSLGLEYGSQRNLDKAVRMLLKNRVVKFFQIGNTLTGKLLGRARELLEHGVILPNDPFADAEVEGIRVYTQAEFDFLKVLPTYRTTISTLQLTIRDTHLPRALTQLAEIEVIDRQLACIENRMHYVKALPLDSLFSLDPPLSIVPDATQHLTLGLIVNLVLYRQINFQLGAAARADFHQLAYVNGEMQPSLRQQLLDWIARYLEQAYQPDAVKQYALAYWDDCLRMEGRKAADKQALSAI